MAVTPEYPLITHVREWWKAALDGKQEACIPALTEEAVHHFLQDQDFRHRFTEAFAYPAIYSAGIRVLSENRGDPGLGDFDDDIVSEDWFEYEPGLQRHIALAVMTPEQAASAAAFREKNIAKEVRRIAMLKEIANGANPATVAPDLQWFRDSLGRTNSTLEKQGRGGRFDVGSVRVSDEGDGITFEYDRNAATPSPVETEADDGWFGQDVREHSSYCRHCHQWIDWKEYKDGTVSNQSVAAYFLCFQCTRFFPPSLLKASQDPFDYSLRLRTGEIVHFETCELKGEWVHLKLHSSEPNFGSGYRHETPEGQQIPYQMARGLDVRLADIVWCADAPEGS